MQSLFLRSCFRSSRCSVKSTRHPLTIPWRCHKARPFHIEGQSKRSLLTKAYNVGPTEPPLLEQTIPEHFDGIVSQYGDRPAVISHHQDLTVTYRELQEKSNSIARGLQSLGVKKGDRVAVSMGNCMEFAIVTYSLFRLGAILVPLNPAFTSSQVTAALNHLSASHLIIGAETALPFKSPLSNLPLLSSLVSDPESKTLKSALVPSLTHIIVSPSPTSDPFSTIHSLTPFSDLSTSSTSPPQTPTLSPTDTINIQFTSGTTSTPKAAQLTHLNILNNGHSIGARLGLTPSDIICCPPPLFHCFGCVLGYMATATHGASILFPSPAFDPAQTLAAVSKYRATGLYGVPTMFNAELALLSDSNPSPNTSEPTEATSSGNNTQPPPGFTRLRTGIAAGSSVPASLMRKLHARLGLRDLAICYGMTETSPVSAMTTAADSLSARTDTVGKLMPHVRAKVVAPDTGVTGGMGGTEPLGVGERGELWVSGYLLMKGYWGEDGRTREVLVREWDVEGEGEGMDRTWMRTGDEASIDAEGYVRITGRIKDLIIRGGENVHPLEVEDCVLGMEGVGDVSVVGVPDERYGEVVAAFVVRSGKGEKEGGGVGGEQVREWVRGRLSRHLVPKYVFFTEAFPKTASGKVQKFALREEAERLVRDGKGLD